MLSPEVKEPDALGLAEFVGRQAPGTAIVLVRDHTWNGLLPAAMRAGIRDVVDMTQGAEELRDAVERAIVWASNLRSVSSVRSEGGHTSRKGSIMSVFSSKGGAGKTFLTTNLACAVAEITGEDTAVVDLDFDMGDVFTYFGVEPASTHPRSDGPGRGRAARSRSGPWACRSASTYGPTARRRTRPPRRPPASRSASSCGRCATTSRTCRRRVGRLLGLGARLLRPVRHHLPRHRPRRRGREAPGQGARHPPDDRRCRASGSASC